MDFNPELLQNLLSSELHYDQFKTGPMDEMSISQARIGSLMSSLFKKWEPEDSSILEAVAIDTFKSSNAKCETAFTLPSSTLNKSILETARDLIYQYFNSGLYQTSIITLDSCLQVGMAGPGASKSTKATDFYTKMFGGRLSSTSIGLYKHYTHGISQTWLAAERLRAKRFQVDIVAGSNLSSVPKNGKTNRTICTEPSLNMFYQLGCGKLISGLNKKYHDIDLSIQPDINKAMARAGSLDGRFATIDLSSASDTISIGLVQYLLPPLTFSVLQKIRSPLTEYKGESIELKMISSMGNGFTFPLQTLIFATLVRATYIHTGIKPRVGTMRNYSVFGDDIICESSRFDEVVSVLTDCGFTVNKEKSFATGPFRESCGGDYFKGHDIRGVYIRKVKNAADSYSVFNRLIRWSGKSGIPIPNAIHYVKGLADFRPVPLHSGDTEGNKIPRDQLLAPKTDKNGAVWYRPLSARIRNKRVKETDFNYNPDGMLIASIGGYVRAEKVTLRVNNVTFKVVRRKTPSWNFISDPGLTIRDYQLSYEWNKLCETIL